MSRSRAKPSPVAGENRPQSDPARVRRSIPETENSARDALVSELQLQRARRLDAIMDFVGFAVRPMPLSKLLDETPRRLAAIVGADVVSLYLREGGGDLLVMRGNVGFPELVLGRVRLHVGEGITGTVVECMRPISVRRAQKHEGYRHFPELGEDAFPVFAAVPIIGRSGALGVITAQRGGATPFDEHDIELLVALSGSISAGIRHAELLDSFREKVPRHAGGGTRKVTLPGRPLVPGRALGALAVLRRPPSRPAEGARGEEAARRLASSFDSAQRALAQHLARAEHLGLARDSEFLQTYQQIVTDARLRGRAQELVRDGESIARALGQVAREATRAAAGIHRDAFLEDRARDIEDLCDALAMLAESDPRVTLPTKAILMGDQLTVFDLLVSSRAQPVGIVLTERAAGPRVSVLSRLLGIPTMVDVAALFRWASEGDIALLDADHGLLIINPSRAEISLLRRDRRPPRIDE